MKKQLGFTLVELMVVVAIIAILAAVAIPAFQHQAMESRRADAKSALLDLATREERYYANNNVYTSAASSLYGTGASLPLQVPTGSTPDYQISVSIPSSTTPAFALSASPMNLQVGDACGTYQLDNTGAQTNTPTPPSGTTCW